ncbi:DMT family transporter [uncultured Tateyamaria sp.]|uniref:DMT family transporter n=1 Tax=uncultured Tateyamaria sp. TaxID=455651 RepID=UPI00262C357B|nr:DMT family transporter [uncultured Tateyamaria sp.]
MNNAVLFIATVFVWGTSWIAITWQIGSISVMVSVAYRMGLAAVLLLLVLAAFGKLARPKVWRFVALQAALLFSFNFVALYNATSFITSGQVSVIFSLASVFNAINARLFFGTAITRRVLFAGLIGFLGLILLFWDDLTISAKAGTLVGVAWATLGTALFSLGNMASRQNSAVGVTPVIANAWGMGLGAAMLLLIAAASGVSIPVPTEARYVAALFYLAVFASIIGFTCYLVLVDRIGAAQAGYATVLFPIVALVASSIFEGFEWTVLAIAGIALTIAGNVVMFGKSKPA